jgi:Flp pilus assembly protein TadG
MRRSWQTGAVSTELAVLTPLLIGFMLLVVFAGRVVQTEADISHAAYEAARAASLTGGPTAAETAANASAADNIAEGGVACRELTVVVDTTMFAAGGRVGVTVTCEASYADLTLLAVPGTRTITSTAVEVIDTHRADPETTS